jgi:AraC-like DNA-binding protein
MPIFESNFMAAACRTFRPSVLNARAGDNGEVSEDWSRYWRSADEPLEAMYAHFERHVYHRHSHDGYSFGVTEDGAQSFRCRGGGHTSVTGMVMAFNPDDPHDGHAADALGFTYRIIHIGPALVASVLADITGRSAPLPLFAEPVHNDRLLASRLTALHRGLLGGATVLRRNELLTAAVGAMTRRAAAGEALPASSERPASATAAARAREYLRAAVAQDVTSAQLAAAAGCSRFALHRAFTAAYGMTPADYQRQLRLRSARRLIAAGRSISAAAAETGFADQSHLTRWFSRYYGITPGGFRDTAVSLA